ncbi:MAG TPA: TonB family protein [Terriglobales bacterium]|nr:TonB family protein [Terriglobales bacterium]
MHSSPNSVTETPQMSAGRLHFLLEPEPWLKNFLRNLADVFRTEPAQPRTTSRPGRYWPDALVRRPVAWRAMRQSFLGHVLVVVSGYGLNLLWLSRPQVIEIEVPQTTISHYELSPYLPAVDTEAKKPEPPQRPRAQSADPEYAKQEIVSLHDRPDSLRQTIVTPNPNLLRQDVPLPNLVASAPVPVAPLVNRERYQELPAQAAQVVAPAQQAAERGASRLIFPVPPQPEVVPPASAATANHAVPALPLNGPVVVPPSQSIIARDPNRLQLPAQAPDVAAPAAKVAQRNASALLPLSRPDVVPPAQSAAGRNLAAMDLPEQPQSVTPPARGSTARSLASLPVPVSGQNVVPPASSVAQRNLSRVDIAALPQTVVPPSQPVTQGAQVGRLLALNVQPIAPVGPVSVPEGNRRGEFAASPEGQPGATARPETRAVENNGPSTLPRIFVAPPPNKIVADAVVSAPPPSLPKPSTPLERADVPPDRIDNQVFAGRKHYAIRLSMPNINSAMGSWIIRFAELHPESPNEPADLSTPEPVRKVDPAYPAAMVRDRIEGVVVLRAIIRSDGSVSDVRVLEGFDARLDENARIALEQWRFRPGTRNGVPVDVEAVVRVPFRVPKPAF